MKKVIPAILLFLLIPSALLVMADDTPVQQRKDRVNDKIQKALKENTVNLEMDNWMHIYRESVKDEIRDQRIIFRQWGVDFKQDHPFLANILVAVFGLLKHKPLFFLMITVSLHLIYSYPIYAFAEHLQMADAGQAWTPVMNLLLLIDMAEKPLWWFVLLFVPVIQFFIFIGIWASLNVKFNKPAGLAVLSIIPGVNLFYFWFIALSLES